MKRPVQKIKYSPLEVFNLHHKITLLQEQAQAPAQALQMNSNNNYA